MCSVCHPLPFRMHWSTFAWFFQLLAFLLCRAQLHRNTLFFKSGARALLCCSQSSARSRSNPPYLEFMEDGGLFDPGRDTLAREFPAILHRPLHHQMFQRTLERCSLAKEKSWLYRVVGFGLVGFYM